MNRNWNLLNLKIQVIVLVVYVINLRFYTTQVVFSLTVIIRKYLQLLVHNTL